MKQMSFLIPRSRIIEWNGEMSGGAELPADARPIPLVGGATSLTTSGTSGPTRDKLYLVVNSLGEPSLTKSRKQKIYEASSPSAAATKAFYAWWRATQKQDMKVIGLSTAAKKQGQDWQRLQSHLDKMQEKHTNLGLERFLMGRRRYEDSWLKIDREGLQKRQLLVRLAALGGKGPAVTRNYIVGYQPNVNPNVLELLGPAGGNSAAYTPIVVNAHATHLPRDAPLTAGDSLHFLERELELFN